MSKSDFPKPFDGAISKFLNDEAPKEVRSAIKDAKKSDILNPTYPYDKRLDKDEYEESIDALQIELVKFQTWVRESGTRVAIVFEGRDARYIQHLPAAGEIAFFDRSWYNRGVVEKVFGWVEDDARERFFKQVPQFETMLRNDGIHLIKLWLNVGRAEQLRRFLKRESDPLKQWKLSSIDVKGLSRWDEYTSAIQENFAKTHHDAAPWTIIRSDDKSRARIAAIRTVLSQFDYDGKDSKRASPPDPKISGGPELMADG